jgi:predicted glycosyltransferase
MNASRLDLLIYAHDGRGLGHASRSIAVGMAVRRLYPEIKLLFLTGSRMVSQLVDHVPLDWVKLPAYQTKVVDGVSTGQSSFINFADTDLGVCRSRIIEHLIGVLRPRCILADHTPQGKHKELVPSLIATRDTDTTWVLGVRGWVGSVPQVWSDIAKKLFSAHYKHLLWYGDSRLLGKDQMETLKNHFTIQPLETGYVCRISELDQWPSPQHNTDNDIAGVVSIPWLGEDSEHIIKELFHALDKIGPQYGKWRIFVGSPENFSNQKWIQNVFSKLPFCKVSPADEQYRHALLKAKTAVIYGGYNSLTDIFYANIPAVVLLRGMQDEEQQAHMTRLRLLSRDRLTTCIAKDMKGENLAQVLIRQICSSKLPKPEINLDGAAMAGKYLFEIITNKR